MLALTTPLNAQKLQTYFFLLRTSTNLADERCCRCSSQKMPLPPLLAARPITRVKAQYNLVGGVLGLIRGESDYTPESCKN